MRIHYIHTHSCILPAFLCAVLATSGIDYDVKLWEPLSAEPCSLENLQEVSAVAMLWQQDSFVPRLPDLSMRAIKDRGAWENVCVQGPSNTILWCGSLVPRLMLSIPHAIKLGMGLGTKLVIPLAHEPPIPPLPSNPPTPY
jgi:hypothetical protein